MDENNVKKKANNEEKSIDSAKENQSADTLTSFLQNGFKKCAEATRASNSLPKDSDYMFYSTQSAFNNIIRDESARILTLINKIVRYNEIEDNIKSKSFDDKIELMVDVNDTILERVGTNLDEFNGIKSLFAPEIKTVSANLPVSGSWNKSQKIGNALSKNLPAKKISLIAAKNVIRPQTFFKDKINNSHLTPWMPKLTEKPNSLKPLALELEETEYGEQFIHPYDLELDRFVPKNEFLMKQELVLPKDVNETPLIEISEPGQLDALVEELRKHKEIAVDLEHHSYRTFMGITCLMQISTKDVDYIIDTLALRDKLYVLNEVFTKPSIVKIFHGADMDILWLQRDLSLYIVNMFDTHRAAKQLGYSGLSLAYLLNRFCEFMPDKQFQLADWRIRPLPDELKSYAREDTHYLIYLYRVLVNALLEKGNGNNNILKAVFQMSTEVCKKRYFKPILDENSHLNFYMKCKRAFDNRQMYALKHLYKWRDLLAREEDESCGYILPNHMLLQIAETLPKEVQGIFACCNPIPPLVRAYSYEMHKIILTAREQTLEKPIMKESIRGVAMKESIKVNIESPLHCPHDLTKQQEFRDDLPTLLGKTFKGVNIRQVFKLEQKQSMHTFFNSDGNEAAISTKVAHLHFLGPFERYKLIKPYIQEEEKKAQEEKQKQAKTESKESSKEDYDPSVEERIASLHEHFNSVQKSTNENTNSEMPSPAPPKEKRKKKVTTPSNLLLQGGTKKRKRMESEGNSSAVDPEMPSNHLHTPIPTTPQRYNNSNNKKRRASSPPPPTSDYTTPKPPKRQPKQSKQKNKSANKRQQFVPYDYASVDFVEFSGGASEHRPEQFSSKFSGKKSNKRRGKSNNRSMTYNNGPNYAQGGRGGQGSGRGNARGGGNAYRGGYGRGNGRSSSRGSGRGRGN